MAEPMTVDIPHRLGREEAKRRLKARLGELSRHVPGGAEVKAHWPGEDRMALSVAAFGQSVDATLDVEERLIRLKLLLPPALAFFAGAIEAGIRRKGAELLLDDKSGA